MLSKMKELNEKLKSIKSSNKISYNREINTFYLHLRDIKIKHFETIEEVESYLNRVYLK